MVVFAMTDPSKGTRGISALIVEKEVSKFMVGSVESKMGIRGAPTSEILFQDCPVPKENLLGEEGRGFRIAMAALDCGRPTIAAQAVGLAQGAMEKAIHARIPIVGIIDSEGARIEDAIQYYRFYSTESLVYFQTMASGVIPQISLIMGPCVGEMAIFVLLMRISCSWSGRQVTCMWHRRRRARRLLAPLDPDERAETEIILYCYHRQASVRYISRHQ
jgi:hypothetical protein